MTNYTKQNKMVLLLFIINIVCHFPVGKIAKKAVWRSAFFVVSALRIQCRFVKNTLLQTAFSHWVMLDLVPNQ